MSKGEEKCHTEAAAAAGSSRYRGWKAMPYVIGNEAFEKLGTIGTSSNLLVYLTSVFHMQNVKAATLINIWHGSTNMATLFGAFLSDAYFGRYRTLGFACISSFIGMLLLTLTSGIAKLHPDQQYCQPAGGDHAGCRGATQWQLAFLLTALGFMVVGAGGIRPCNLAFGADQFDPETESGKRGINSFFNWYYFTFTVAMIVSSTVIIYVQSNISWTIGLAIPASLMFLSCAFFFVGSRVYVKVKPEGSPFTGVFQALVASLRKRRRLRSDVELVGEDGVGVGHFFNPPSKSSLVSRLPHTNQFRFLDKAAIPDLLDEINSDGSAVNPWRLCSMQKVEEVKCLLRVIPIWSTGVIYYVSVVQQHTYVVFQALQSNRHIGKSNNGFMIPAGSFIVFAMATLTLWIPIYDKVLVPWLRKLRKREDGITLLERMGVGILLSILTMIISGLVEQRRCNSATSNGNVVVVSSMSSLLLVPQLAISGLSEAFTLIGQVEFYYKQFPENMRSVAGSFLFCGMAVSSYLHSFMLIVVRRTTRRGGLGNWLEDDLNKGRLDYFYYLIAVMGVANLFYFLGCAHWYRYKGQEI